LSHRILQFDDGQNHRDLQFQNIAFSDEATFALTTCGETNRYKCRYWNNENPH